MSRNSYIDISLKYTKRLSDSIIDKRQALQWPKVKDKGNISFDIDAPVN